MTVTKPEHTTEEINDMLFRDALSKTGRSSALEPRLLQRGAHIALRQQR